MAKHITHKSTAAGRERTQHMNRRRAEKLAAVAGLDLATLAREVGARVPTCHNLIVDTPVSSGGAR